ncbi:hypothetical protein [Streptomyces sp. NBC_01589]
MAKPEIAERIAARGAEPDKLEDQLTKHLEEVWPERDELAVVERR